MKNEKTVEEIKNADAFAFIQAIAIAQDERIEKEKRDKMVNITLVLNRVYNDLWLDINGRHAFCIWDVTGLERDTKSLFGHVKILRNGKQIGGCWNVVEITEKWK